VKLNAIRYRTDADETTIAVVTITMTLAELALHVIAGKLNGHAKRRLGLGPDDSLYDVPSQVLCMHYDDGLSPTVPASIDLATLTSRPE
jgi:hypothetical protein